MKKAVALLFTFLVLFTLGVFALEIQDQEEILAADSLIRFHVIANSDSAFDQQVKLKVRDAILEITQPLLTKAETQKEAEALLKEERGEIENAIDEVLTAYHVAYGATCQIEDSLFPTKTYGNVTLPAGTYRAFRVILGDGEGKNWWCVLYPPLCFVDLNDEVSVAVSEKSASADESDVLSVDAGLYQIRFKSKLLELVR